MKSPLVALVRFALLNCSLLGILGFDYLGNYAHAQIVVDLNAPEDTNRRPGIQGPGFWASPSGVRIPDPADACLRNKRFAYLQTALWALNNGLVTDTRIVLVTNGPLPAYISSPTWHPNVSRDLVIRKQVTIEAGPATPPIVEGGTNGFSIYSNAVELKGFEICRASRNGIYLAPGGGPLSISTRPVLDMINMNIHDNGGSGVYINSSLPFSARVVADRTQVKNNGQWGIVGVRRTILDLRGDIEISGNGNTGSGYSGISLSDTSFLNGNGSITAGTSTGRVRSIKIFNNGGSGVFMQGGGIFNLTSFESYNNKCDGLRALRRVQVLVEDSLFNNNERHGIHLDEPVRPAIRRSTINDNKAGGVWLKDARFANGSAAIANLRSLNLSRNHHFGIHVKDTGANLDQITVDNTEFLAGMPPMQTGYGIWAESSIPVTIRFSCSS